MAPPARADGVLRKRVRSNRRLDLGRLEGFQRVHVESRPAGVIGFVVRELALSPRPKGEKAVVYGSLRWADRP
jgi:hypothetical protein